MTMLLYAMFRGYVVLRTRACSIPDGRGTFGQGMGSVSTHHVEEFGYLIICSGNASLENQKRLGDLTYWTHVTNEPAE